MSDHHTKRVVASPSQMPPNAFCGTAQNVTLQDTFVLLCDWHGKLAWKSTVTTRLEIGDYLWKNVSKRSKENLRAAVARVVTLRESCTLEVDNERGEYFRAWMWPLDEPDVAICVLGIRIPSELARLTDREKACLRCLAQGMSTRDISKELEIGLTTVHTHLRRSREKLGLASPEALISFAARYFFVPVAQDLGEGGAGQKRSG